MLDLHVTTSIPGTTVTPGTAAPAIAANDGATVAGVPIKDGARLILWGAGNIAADAIAIAKLISQDQVDALNGEIIYGGTASVKTLVYKFTDLLYKSGGRVIYTGTNTGHGTASINFLLDYYDLPGAIGAGNLRFAENIITIPQLLHADVAATWYETAFAPTQAMPNGKYAILGFFLGQSTESHGIRFKHAAFNGLLPGIPCLDHFIANTCIDDPLKNEPGFQFVKLSELTGKPCVPVFNATNAGTGLNIHSIAAANTDTPQISLNLAKVG